MLPSGNTPNFQYRRSRGQPLRVPNDLKLPAQRLISASRDSQDPINDILIDKKSSQINAKSNLNESKVVKLSANHYDTVEQLKGLDDDHETPARTLFRKMRRNTPPPLKVNLSSSSLDPLEIESTKLKLEAAEFENHIRRSPFRKPMSSFETRKQLKLDDSELEARINSFSASSSNDDDDDDDQHLLYMLEDNHSWPIKMLKNLNSAFTIFFYVLFLYISRLYKSKKLHHAILLATAASIYFLFIRFDISALIKESTSVVSNFKQKSLDKVTDKISNFNTVNNNLESPHIFIETNPVIFENSEQQSELSSIVSELFKQERDKTNKYLQSINNEMQSLRSEIASLKTLHTKNLPIEDIENVLLQNGIEKHSRPNFASTKLGAKILSNLNKSTYDPVKASKLIRIFYAIFSLKFKSNMNQPEAILDPNNEPGNCWVILGDTGQVGVHLASKVLIEEIGIDHMRYDKNLEASSALRKFEIWASFPSENDRNRMKKSLKIQTKDHESPAYDFVLLGEFEYDINKHQKFQKFSIVSFSKFETESNPPQTQDIVLRVKSNWGNPTRTTVYRLRVYGLVKPT